MKNKIVIIMRLIYTTCIALFLIYLFSKISSRKFILIPFLICSFAMVGKNICILIEKQNYTKIFTKIFILSFLSFWFGFLIFWCYINFIDKNYMLLLLSIPFWIIGITVFKKNFFKAKSISNHSKIKPRFDIRMMLGSILVIGTFLIGIFLLFFGIRDTCQLNEKTKNYIITNGYYKDYNIYDDEEGTAYKLIYIYEVNDKKYSITTDYKTNHIPEKNSIREVKYDPNNPEEAVLVGMNNKSGFIYVGAFFTLVSFTFIILALTILGYFNKFKVDILGTYIGIVCLVVGIGIILFQNGTTMSFWATVQSFGLWILIPFLFIIVGVIQIMKCLFLKRDNREN